MLIVFILPCTIKIVLLSYCLSILCRVRYLPNHLYSKIRTPTTLQKWSIHYSASANVSPRIFKLPFKTVRDSKIQTFRYRIIPNIIPCNKWLHNIKIKNSPVCDYCNNVDDLPHYFIRCPKVAEFWCYWFNWRKNISGMMPDHTSWHPSWILLNSPVSPRVWSRLMHHSNILVVFMPWFVTLLTSKDISWCLKTWKLMFKWGLRCAWVPTIWYVFFRKE